PRRRRGAGRPFPKGVSGNPRGSRVIIERRAAIEADLVGDMGGDISAADRVLLSRGVELLTRKPRSHTDAVRLVNAGTRIIDKLHSKYAKREPERRSLPSLSELLKATQIERGRG